MLAVGRTFGRLNRRFALGTAAGLLVSSLVFFVLYLGLYQEQLARQREETATQNNRLLRTSLENAMHKRDLEGLRDIVNRLGQQPGITRVTITNASGQIRFSSQPGQFGSDFAYPIPSQPTTAFVAEPGGGKILRSANPQGIRLRLISLCGKCLQRGLRDRPLINQRFLPGAGVCDKKVGGLDI